jgi:hypothetical protein
MNRFREFAILLFTASLTASAHPGHGHYGSVAAHSLAHLAIATIVGLVLIGTGLPLRYRKRQPARVSIKK